MRIGDGLNDARKCRALIVICLLSGCTSPSETDDPSQCEAAGPLTAGAYSVRVIPRFNIPMGFRFEVTPDGSVAGHVVNDTERCDGTLTPSESQEITRLLNENESFCASSLTECPWTDPPVYDFELIITAGADTGFENRFVYAHCGEDPTRDALFEVMREVMQRLDGEGRCIGEPYVY